VDYAVNDLIDSAVAASDQDQVCAAVDAIFGECGGGLRPCRRDSLGILPGVGEESFGPRNK